MPEAQRRELNEVARRQSARAFSGGCSEVTPATVAGQVGAFFLTDANCYRRLFRELTRFVSSAMSPNNPNCHVPTDAEIQHQARCIIFDELAPYHSFSYIYADHITATTPGTRPPPTTQSGSCDSSAMLASCLRVPVFRWTPMLGTSPMAARALLLRTPSPTRECSTLLHPRRPRSTSPSA